MAGASAAILLAGMLPRSTTPFVQAGLWGATLWALLLHADRFPALPRAELEFVDAYIDLVRRVESLYRRADTLDPATHVAEFQEITESAGAAQGSRRGVDAAPRRGCPWSSDAG